MELWIRSQNKEKLVKVNELSLYDSNILENILNAEPKYSDIKIIANDNYNLGSYKTKERALEVLDEIQSILKPKCIINSKSMKFSDPYEENGIVLMDCSADARLEQLSTYVYEMPLD